MRNLILAVCATWLVLVICQSEAKPQGCSRCAESYEKDGDKCCDDCEPCRSSFNMEQPPDGDCKKPKNYQFAVQHIKTHCKEEHRGSLDADFEGPPEQPCKKYYNNYFKIQKPHSPPCPDEMDYHDFEIAAPVVPKRCKSLKLTAKIDHHPRHCACEHCT
ncbi:uncharacterized protein LOC129758037 [Uranotaenia lowii]|uniref:uncharacterized protein LOC129758037 n=1 Tax=Uranotaenia lowii TaxID=190385 RepID=UPI00247AEF6F|nr:uncharacterized protein LOC129758037 [Uranotaenia lowii]